MNKNLSSCFDKLAELQLSILQSVTNHPTAKMDFQVAPTPAYWLVHICGADYSTFMLFFQLYITIVLEVLTEFVTVFEILIDIFVFFVGLTKIVCVQSKYPNKSSASLLCSISQVHIYTNIYIAFLILVWFFISSIFHFSLVSVISWIFNF